MSDNLRPLWDFTLRFASERWEIPTDEPSLLWGELVQAYRTPVRAYHTLRHAFDVVDTVRRFAGSGIDPFVVQFAAWFHDAVYDTQDASQNEEKSASLAEDALLRLWIPFPVIDRVRSLILATASHEAEDPESMLLMDADLEVLGQAPTIYFAYTQAIREEYAWVPDEEYRSGRARVLESFLQRPFIYQTPLFRSAMEERARLNITTELEHLRHLSSG